MRNTLRSKLLFWFLGFSTFTFVVTIAFNAFYFKKRANIRELSGEITQLHVEILRTFMSLEEFFTIETNNVQYFETGQSPLLEEYQNSLEYINRESERLGELSEHYGLGISANLAKIQEDLISYDVIAREMLKLISTRGFKDYGLEGEMRDYVHILENFAKLDQTQVLSLRRHEKDYIIRNEQQYVDKLNELGEVLKNEVRNSAKLHSWEKDSIINIVGNYMALFNRMVRLDRELGIRDGSQGYMHQLNMMSAGIEKEFGQLVEEAETHRAAIFRQLEVLFAIFFAILVSASLFLSWRISRKITAPLRNLTVYIGKLIQGGFRKVEDLKTENSHHEIEVLNAEFLEMIDLLNEREVQRDLANQALRESEFKYRELAEMLPLSVYETDKEGKLTYVNKSWIDQFGFQWEDVKKGLWLKDIMPVDWDELVSEDASLGREYEAQRKNGTPFPGLMYTDKIVKDGNLEGLRGIVLDIEDRKKYIEELKLEKRKAEESDRLKSAFLANMSHEIRTPMNAILGFSDLLAQLDVDKTKRVEFIKQIKSSGNLLLNLIDDIIDIAKIEAGEISIKPDYTLVHPICEELVPTFRELIKKAGKGARLDIQFKAGSGDPQFAIYTDGLRLKQVLSNLIGNAIKFTEKGMVEFGYEIRDDKVLFFVKDTGIGLSPENLKMIFERFRQVEDAHTRRYGGTGLGLAISKNLVEILGGEIWVESEQFRGTTFYFHLPNELINRGRITEAEVGQPALEAFKWQTLNLLIAEDDEPNARFLMEALGPMGVNLERVANGKEAVDYCMNGKTPDLILMDIQMPVMDGITACREIKKHYPELPVIAQTAYAMAGEKEKCLAAGCDDYIAKPIRINELKQMIFRLISASEVMSTSGKLVHARGLPADPA